MGVLCLSPIDCILSAFSMTSYKQAVHSHFFIHFFNLCHFFFIFSNNFHFFSFFSSYFCGFQGFVKKVNFMNRKSVFVIYELKTILCDLLFLCHCAWIENHCLWFIIFSFGRIKSQLSFVWGKWEKLSVAISVTSFNCHHCHVSTKTTPLKLFLFLMQIN